MLKFVSAYFKIISVGVEAVPAIGKDKCKKPPANCRAGGGAIKITEGVFQELCHDLN